MLRKDYLELIMLIIKEVFGEKKKKGSSKKPKILNVLQVEKYFYSQRLVKLL